MHKQLLEEEREGLMLHLTLHEAIERFALDLIIAAKGAIEKKGREGEVRVVFDVSSGCPRLKRAKGRWRG